MFKHIGITITDPIEIEDFYKELLGLELEREFMLSKELNQKIFGFYEDVPVYLLKNGDVNLEIFVTQLPSRKNYTHLCVELENREAFVEIAKQKGYRTVVLERSERPDLIFVRDKFGNLFEIKEKE
jgi:catechol 2,3-dioxygenase-like lactoylglutathione lyase family enzyme